MHRFLRWYNQNRMQFYLTLGIIVFIFLVIQILNSVAEQNLEQKKSNISNTNSSTSASTTISKTNESVITGGKISSYDDATNTNLIKQFIEYCNTRQIDKAYDMLTDECRELLYPTLRDFAYNYWNKIFYINRMYSLENWYSTSNLYTYYIKYTEDVLASGNTNSEDNKGDYITVVKNNGEYKLNIGSYIGRYASKKQTSKNNVQATVNYIDMYMDYTIVNISVKNNTRNTICIDTKENIDSMYIYDENNVKYTSFLNEIALEQLVVYRNMTNTLNIKFNKIYNPDRYISGIVLSDMVLNYENYKARSEKKDKIIINIDNI